MSFMNRLKEVYFHVYCPKCKHEKVNENEYPCSDCMNRGCNEFSHKPVYFEEKEK